MIANLRTEVANMRSEHAKRLADLEADRTSDAKRLADLEADRTSDAKRLADLEADRTSDAKRLEHLEAEVDLLLDSTLPGLPVVLRTVLDAHLFQLGFDARQAQPSRSRFITSHLVALAAALGVSQNQVEQIFE
jgi:hypothetical protein